MSPLCCILDGCSTCFICKGEELSFEKYRAKGVVKIKYDEFELYWLSLFIRAAPCKGVCGGEAPCLFMPDSPNRVQGLNDLFLWF